MKGRDIRGQVMVVTGASSGIGRATARLAAERGATVVLVARDRQSLCQAVKEIRAAGGDATYVVADVSELEQVEEVARQAVGRFERIDTWVNNAGVSIYGACGELPLEDARALFDINYWGVVHGCRVATEQMRARGGTIINVGSALSEHAIPLQGHYSASKHAVKGFTEALRMELERQGVPVSVTLVKPPSSTATPHPQHAESDLGCEPSLPPPLYAPSVVAAAILDAAQRPRREVTIGAGGRAIEGLARAVPRCVDLLMEGVASAAQRRNGTPASAFLPGNLHGPIPGSDREEGRFAHRVILRSSAADRGHPALTLLALGIGTGLGLGLAALRAGRMLDGARS